MGSMDRTVPCSHCKGTGKEFASMSLVTGEIKYRTCSVCGGTGSVATERSDFTQYPDLSLRKAIELMEEHGKPAEICIAGNHDFRVLFPDGSRHVLGGFTVGYRGTGPDYTQRFLDAAGFNITKEEIAEMKPPITLTAGQPYIAPKTLLFRARTVEEAKKAALDSVPPDAEIIALEVVFDGTKLEKWEKDVYTTLDDASQRARSFLSESAEILEEKIEDDTNSLTEGTADGEGDSEDDATEKAKTKLPQGASITEKKIFQEGKQGVAVVDDFREGEARWKIERMPLAHQAPEGAIVTSIECIREPRRGFLGTKRGTYKVSWRLPWKVTLTYRRKKVVLTYRHKPTVKVTYQSHSKSR